MNKIDKAIEILQAFKERKVIEFLDSESSEWTTFKGDSITNLLMRFIDYDMRVKPQPTYRPYTSADEFISE